ncbi:hypothetical protein N8893_01540 [Porticoccaceae bacterium]|nr:hypothetical protein [Porticoccaceae bacterium]
MYRLIILSYFFSLPVLASDNELFSIDKWEGAGGDTMFYYIHLDIKQPRVEISCRLYNKNGDLIDGKKSRFYESGWEKIVMGTGQRTNATEIKCRGKKI